MIRLQATQLSIGRRLPVGLSLLCMSILSSVPLRAQEPSAAAQSAVAGAGVFGEQRCGVCHRTDEDSESIGPNLRNASSHRDVYGITAALWNHVPDMARMMDSLAVPRPDLSAREAGDLVAYLYALGGWSGSGSAERGAALYRRAGCIRCHRIGSTGGVIGPALDRIPSLRSPHGLAAGLWNHSGAMIPQMREMGISYPTLTASDLADLEALIVASGPADERIADADFWVLPGDAERGARLVERQSCATCHRIAGRGAGTAPELAVSGARRTVGEYQAALWNKGPAMRAAYAERGTDPPTLEPGEMADLTAYLQSLGYFVNSGSAARGQDVIQTVGCLDCHRWSDRGTGDLDLARVPPNPEMAARLAVLWNHVGVLNPSELGPEDWSTLSRSEMADLLEFLGTGAR